VTKYLSRLSESELGELEAKALSQACGMTADGYRRATAAGNLALAKHYRQVILEQYVRRTMASDASLAGTDVTQPST
jgi:hypothetical protein